MNSINTFPYESPVTPASVGIDADKLTGVITLFKKQQSSGAFPGGQFVARRNGKLVVNETVGIARGFRSGETTPLMKDNHRTPFPVLSAGKPLAAICIALLEERGLLDIKAPIVQLFPEFGQHGKEHITTLDGLTHRSGLLIPDFVKTPGLWGNRAAI